MKTPNTKKILVVEAGGIGDMVLAEPSIAALKRAFPGSDLSVLGVPRAIPVLQNCRHVDHSISLDQPTLLNGRFVRRYSHLIRSFLVVARLRLQRFDVALNLYQLYSLQGTQRMKLLFRLIGAKETYGRNTAGRGSFYTKSVPDPEPPDSVHEVEMNLRVVRLLGIEAPLVPPKFWVNDSDRAAAARLLHQSWRESGRPVAALCPGAEVPNKMWRAERYAAVGLELARRFGARIIVLGGTADSKLISGLSPIFESGGISLIGRTSLPMLAGVLERCALLVTNDSGPMHIAAAIGTPIVALFGPGSRIRFGPVGEGHIVFQHQVECSPCWDFQCRRMLCLDSVSVEDVVAAASQLLARSRASAALG